jgi:hypothetical protein
MASAIAALQEGAALMKLAVLIVAMGALLCAGGDWALSPTPYTPVLFVAVPLALTASGLSAVAAARRQCAGVSGVLIVVTLFGALAIFSGVSLAAVQIGKQPSTPLPEHVTQVRLWILTPLFVLPLAALGSLLVPSRQRHDLGGRGGARLLTHPPMRRRAAASGK